MNKSLQMRLKTESLPLAILVLEFVFASYFYVHFPAVVATHWSISGQVNGYMGRFDAALVLPLVSLGIYFLFLALPYLDPKQANYAKFAQAYQAFRSLLLGALFLVYLAIGFHNLGHAFDISKILQVVIGLLFVGLGYFTPSIKPNWFVGIRTPWTLSSETVWQKTHALGGRLIMLDGLIGIISIWLPGLIGIWLFVISLVIMIVWMVAYSYVEYQREQKLK